MPKYRVVRGEDLVEVERAARNFVALMREFRPTNVHSPHQSEGSWVAFVCSGQDTTAQLNAAMWALEQALDRIPSLTARPPRPG